MYLLSQWGIRHPTARSAVRQTKIPSMYGDRPCRAMDFLRGQRGTLARNRRGTEAGPGSSPGGTAESRSVVPLGLEVPYSSLIPALKRRAIATESLRGRKAGQSKMWVTATRRPVDQGCPQEMQPPKGRGRPRRNIERQEEHHRGRPLEEELRSLLRKHRVEFDERYLFD
jgi:hypothetical protein